MAGVGCSRGTLPGAATLTARWASLAACAGCCASSATRATFAGSASSCPIRTGRKADTVATIIKTEHAGAKNGGGYWGRRVAAKAVSRSRRRANAKREIREQFAAMAER